MKNYERGIKRLKKEIKKIDEFFYLTDEHEPLQRFGMLERKRDDIVRAAVLQIQTACEDLLNSLLIVKILDCHERDRVRRLRTVSGKYLRDLLEGQRSLGFFAKTYLAVSLKLITKRQADGLLAMNSLRNKCAHNWLLKAVVRRNRKPRQNKLPLLRYGNLDLHSEAGFRKFMDDGGGMYLMLWKKLYMSD